MTYGKYDLTGCSFGLNRNDVCDYLLCKFRCPKSKEPKAWVKIGKMLCLRNVRSISKSIDEKEVHSLPEECKWYLYWRGKLLNEDTDRYAETEDTSKKLISTAATLMNEENKKKIVEARKHRSGTKARLKDLSDFIYTYEHYVHPLLMETAFIDNARQTIAEFNAEFMEEMENLADKANDFHLLSTLRYIECAREVMIHMDDAG